MDFSLLTVGSTVREKIAFSKDEVQIHPDVASLDDDYLEGTIQIVERPGNEVFIEWLATRRISSLSAAVLSGDAERELRKHNVRIDIRYLKSIRRVTPQSGWPYLTFCAKDGSQYPPLHFHSRGTSAFLDALAKYVAVTRSQSDPHIYMVSEHDKEALVKSFNELAIFPDTHSLVSSQFASVPLGNSDNSFTSIVTSLFRKRPVIPSPGSTIRSTSSHHERTPSKTSISSTISASASSTNLRQSETGNSSSHARNSDGDSASKFGECSTKATEFNFVAENDGEFEVVTTASPQRSALALNVPQRRPLRRRGPAVTDAVWRSFADSNGAIRDSEALRLRTAVFRGSLDSSARKEGWKALLRYVPLETTREQRVDLLKQRREEYYAIKLQWRSVTAEQEANWSAYRERRSLIEKDVHRTDRELSFFAGENNPNLVVLHDILVSYTFYNQDLGYVQGMSDLLAPCLQVLQDEVDAFWCFVGLMKRLASNFELDQSSMKRQLGDVYRVLQFLDAELCNHLEAQDCQNMYFCFRWLLIHFKREFALADTLRLWETFWSDLPCRNYALIFAVAILDRERGVILENNFGYSEILRHVNSLARQLSLDELLERAECVFMQLYDAYRLKFLPDELVDLFALGDVDPTQIGFELDPNESVTIKASSENFYDSHGEESFDCSPPPIGSSHLVNVGPDSVDLRAASHSFSFDDIARSDQRAVIDDFQRIAGLIPEMDIDENGVTHESSGRNFRVMPSEDSSQQRHALSSVAN